MKKALFIFLLATSLYAQIKTEPIDKIASIAWKYEIKDTMLAFSPSDVASYNNSNVILTDLYSKKLYKFEKNTNKFIQLSRNGSGPGEYKFPATLTIYNNNIYYTDYVAGTLQAIDINGKYSCKVDLKMRMDFYNPIAMMGKDKVFTGKLSVSKYWLYDSDFNGHFEVKKCFNKFPIVIAGGSVMINKDIVYYVNPLEFIIYYYNTKNKKEEAIELKGLDNIFNWKPYYKDVITQSEYKDIDEYKWKIKPTKLFKLIINNKLYFGLSYYRTKKESFSLAIFNEHGNCLKNIELGKLNLFAIENGVLKLYKTEERTLKGFYFYTINKKFWDSIK